MEKRARICVRGVVQGVGFRPFVYRLAHEQNLTGWVRNTSGSVEIEAEGEFQTGDIGFSTVRMNHFGMDAYGYRFTYNGRKIAFTGDTGACPQLDRLCDGADIAITEFTHAVPSDDPNHLDVETVARLTALLRARGATVLATHMRETPDPIEGLLICRDGETYLV